MPRTKLGEVSSRAARGLMSPSTLSTELDSLRAGAKVAQTVTPPTRKPRARRRKAASIVEKEKTEKTADQDSAVTTSIPEAVPSEPEPSKEE
jgi:hypothetical protein